MGDDDHDGRVWNLRRFAVVVATVALSACTGTPSPGTPGDGSTSLPVQGVITTTTAVEHAVPAVHKLGEPFTVGDGRVTVLSIQDPFPSTPQLRPGPGNRLLSVRYEVVSQGSEPQTLSGLPLVEVRDSTGASYRSEHGRVSAVAGSSTAGEVPAARRMESNAVFEVPASATGLRVVVRSAARPGDEGVVVTLE